MNRRHLLTAGLAPWLPGVRAAAAAAAGPQEGDPAPLSWFCWRARPWLDDPAALPRQLPPGSRRVLLGLDPHQLREAAAGHAVADLLRTCHQAGLRVDLLLGEPSWVREQPRRHLLALLRGVAHLPFDGLQLDLEHDAGLGLTPAAWQAGVLDTLRAVRLATPWPLALTTHGQALEHPAFVAALAEAGVGEVVAMLYVSFAHLVVRRAARVLAAAAAAGPGLRVTIAQSCEPQLAAGESWHRLGQLGALRAWAALARELGAHRQFDGLAIQSLEAFHQAAP